MKITLIGQDIPRLLPALLAQTDVISVAAGVTLEQAYLANA